MRSLNRNIIDLGFLLPEPKPNLIADVLLSLAAAVAVAGCAALLVAGIGFLCLVVGV